MRLGCAGEAKAKSVRDLLTALAGAVVLILVAALAVPPFIDWSGQRALIDRAIAQSLGTPASSAGAIDLRLLPSPHLRLDQLRLGAEDGPSLEARQVDAEIALSPLLKGEVRFTRTSIERARVTLPVADDALLLPRGGETPRRDVVIEALTVRHLSVATWRDGAEPSEIWAADDVRLRAPNLAGPWLAEGMVAGSPFHLATGVVTSDGTLNLKFTGGGDTLPRLEADARLTFKPEAVEGGAQARRGLVPEAEGSAKLTVGPPVQAAGDYLPLTLAGKFEARGTVVNAKSVELELDPGGKAARLSGTGRIDWREGRAGLDLRTRRLDLDGLLLTPGGRALLSRGAGGLAPSLPMMLDLDLKAESVALGLDDWSDVAFRGTFDRSGGLVLRRFSGLAPGAATVSATGEIDLSASARFTGHLDIAARNSEGLGRYLGRLGAEDAVASLLDGRTLDLGADLSSTATDLSLRNLRLALGPVRVTGNAAYTRPQAGRRGRLEAQIAANGIDIAELPPASRLMESLDRHDLGLTLSARDVRYGASGGAGGTIMVRLQSDGASLVVDSLEIADLAGASAKLAGRIAPDGSGKIEGRVSAPKAAPLLALLERGFLAEARLVPRAFREAGLDLDLTLERESGEADALRAQARGKAGGGEIEASALIRAGRIDNLAARLDVARAGLWFGRDDIAALRQPARLRLTGTRSPGAETTRPNEERLAPEVAPVTRSWHPGPHDRGSVSGPEPRLAKADPARCVRSPPALGGGPNRRHRPHALSGPDRCSGVRRRTPARFGHPRPVASGRGAASRSDGSGRRIRHHRCPRPPSGWGGDGRGVPRTAFPAGPDHRPDPAHGPPGHPVRPGAGSAAGQSRSQDRPTGSRPRICRRGGGLPVAPRGRCPSHRRPHRRPRRRADRRERDGDAAGRCRLGLGGSHAVGREPRPDRRGRTPRRDIVRGIALQRLRPEPRCAHRRPLRQWRHPAFTDPPARGRSCRPRPGARPGTGRGRSPPRRPPQALVSEEFSAAPLVAKGPATAAVTLVGGVLRSAPFGLDLGPARWNGTFGVDLRSGSLDAKGILTSLSAPKGWSGAPPAVQLGFSGPLGAPERRVDAAPLTTGLAALVLQRELEKIELFDADQAERQRRRARIEMDRARAAAEEAARLARIKAQQAAEEAARRQREAEETARRQREVEDLARRARQDAEPSPETPAPLDITPPGVRP